MQVNDEKLKELLTTIATSDDDCPINIVCTRTPSLENCIECWTEYLKERIW